jgi:predicted transcriptional regulator
MLPREKIRWVAPDEPVLSLLVRMQSDDINQIPVLAGSPPGKVVGIVTRDSILRVIQTRTEVGEHAG